MIKRVSILVMLLAAVVVLLGVSCNGEASLHNEEELVSVCFGESSSRALSASLDSFAGNKESYFWAYEARKIDSSKLRRGETATYKAFDPDSANWVRRDENGAPVAGITDSVLSGFSQGTWKFMLYACKGVLGDNPSTPEVETDYVVDYVLVYKGEKPSVILKNSGANPGAAPNVVSVTVSPVKDAGNGTLAVSVNSIVTASTNYEGQISKVYVGYQVIGSSDPFEFTEVTGDYSVSPTQGPGTYTVKVRFDLKDYSSVISTLVVTVYSNLTTTVDGKIDGVVSSTT